ncbi:hypothetical protein ACV229_28930 [Burkholderia sp. MR1-5-21]
MNSQARPVSLPCTAAVIAAAVTAAPFLSSLYFLSKASSLSADVLAVQLANLIGSLVFRAGLVFLIVLWHGEQRGQLAFRRPALLLTVYASCLLGWQIAQIWIFQALIRSLSDDAANLSLIVTIITPLNAVLYTLVAWLTWWFITHMLRKDALPLTLPGNARRRIAGLAAWLFASVLLSFMTQAMQMLLDYFDDDLKLVMLNYIGTAAIPTALVFAGAMLGLPRDLSRLHGWRLLGASLAAMASVSLLVYVALSILGNVLGTANLMSGMLTVTVLAGTGLAYRMWFRVFYAAVSRPTAETSQGMQSS